MAIETIIFDIGRTLVPFDVRPLEPRLAPCRPAASALGREYEIGAVSSAEFRRRLCELTRLEEAAFSTWWNSMFDDRWLIEPALLERLMAQRRTGLMSNTNALHMEHLRRQYPLLDAFAFQILSYEVGAAKPQDAIYAAAEAQAQCAPDSILYLDDVPEFVDAARRRGWQAELFTGAAALDQQLRRHGLADPD